MHLVSLGELAALYDGRTLIYNVRVQRRRNEPRRWDDDGYWRGDPDLHLFLAQNWLMAAVYYVFFAVFACVVFTHVTDSLFVGIPVGVIVGSCVWVLLMLGFALGLVAEGD